MSKAPLAVLAASLVLFGCTTTGQDGEPQVDRTATGAIVGAVAGGVLGNRIASGQRQTGTVIGAAAGAAVGAGIGHVMDQQEAELKRQLATERAQHQVEIERVREDLLKLTLQNEVMFDFDSAAVKPAFESTLRKLANVLADYDGNRVQIVGHTDGIGSDAYNQGLSERRALAVAEQLALFGVPRGRLEAVGRGKREPRADNATEAGRQLNRRVEIFVQPIA
jgi:outer membrane protein OmpA-like peptidoglycan-associated protein